MIWNGTSVPYGKDREIKKLPFEIIEIGAVKLNQDREYVDRFSSDHSAGGLQEAAFPDREIVRMSQEDLDHGTPFVEAVREFLAWAAGTPSSAPGAPLTLRNCSGI